MAVITTINATDTLRNSRSVINTNFANVNADLTTILGLGGVPGPTGPTGPTGPAGTGIIWRGTWSNVTAYSVDDAVTWQGNSYVAILANTGVTPGTDPTRWLIFAAKGDTGASLSPSRFYTAYSTSSDVHTNNNVWEDVAGLSITFTPAAISSAMIECTSICQPTSGNWEQLHFRLVIDGSNTDTIFRLERSSGPDGARFWTFHFHWFVAALSVASHTIKVQMYDNGSSQDWTFSNRRMTILTVPD